MKRVAVRSGVLVSAMMVGILAVVPGCDWFGGDKKRPAPMASGDGAVRDMSDGSPALFTMNGKTIVTEDMIAQELESLKKQSPEAQAMLEAMGDQFKCFLVNQFIVDAVIGRYLSESGTRDTADFQRRWDEKRRELDREWFGKTLSAQVTESELRDHYKKERDSLVISYGGRRTKGVSFKSEEAAEEFLKAVKSAKGDIDAVAEEAGHEVKDYGLVHKMSIGIDSGLRDKIMDVRSAPATTLVTLDDGEIWVIRISEEEDAKYHEYEDIKEQLREMLEQRKVMDVASKKIEELREEYDIKPVSGAEKYEKGPEDLMGGEGNGGDEELPPMPPEM